MWGPRIPASHPSTGDHAAGTGPDTTGTIHPLTAMEGTTRKEHITMTNRTDQDAREAREWAEYITSARELPGDHALPARAAARFILNNTTPTLPDPLFGAWATHPRHGEGIVISQFPDEDGLVRFVVPDQVVIVDGVSFRWVSPSTLTFHTPDHPDHPEFLESEEDYRNAPEGTIVANNEERPAVLVDDLWRHAGPLTLFHFDMAGIRRRVLRWRWEA